MAHTIFQSVHNYVRILSSRTRKVHLLVAGMAVVLLGAGTARALEYRESGLHRVDDTVRGQVTTDDSVLSKPRENRSQQLANRSVRENRTDYSEPANNSNTQSNTDLRLNGEVIPVPSNGRVSRQVPGSDSIEIEVYSQNSSSGTTESRNRKGLDSSQSDSTIEIDIQAESHSTGSAYNDQERRGLQRNER